MESTTQATPSRKDLQREASDPRTPAPRLMKLSRVGHGVRQAVASNPSAPCEALRRLAPIFPGEVRANPAWPLVLLIDPSLQELTSLPLAHSSDDPATLMGLLRSEQDSVLEALACNAAMPHEGLQALSQHASAPVRRGVASNPSTPLALLQKLATDPDEHVRLWVLRHKTTPPETMRAALATIQPERQNEATQALLSNPSTPGDLLVDACRSPWPDPRRSAASHPHTLPEELARLARDKDNFVRLRVASNPATPPALLDEMASSPSRALRCRIAHNPSAAASTLERLSLDRQSEVRLAVAGNPNTPAATLARLANGPRDRVSYRAKETLKNATRPA